MKKFFTLIAAVAMAASVSAQVESVILPATGNTEDAVAYEGEHVLKSANAQILLGCEDEDYKTKDGAVVSWLGTSYVALVQGSNNPKDDDGKGYNVTKGNLPSTGCYYVFSAAKNGKVELGIQLNNNKPFFVADGETGMNTVEKVIKDEKGAVVTLDADEKSSVKVFGTVTFNVEANKSYYVFCTGSKLSFYGYNFEPDTTPTGISSVESVASAKSGKTYNLAGQEVSSSFKGLVIKNGKKYVK